MDLAVGAPPAGDEAALRLAYEIAAFAPEGDPISDVRGLREFAGTLRSQSVWRFGWPD